MARNLLETTIDGLSERAKLVVEAGERASEMTVKVGDFDSTVADIVQKAVQASVIGIAKQMRAVSKHVRDEAEAIKREDPRSLPAITNIHIAEREAAKLKENSAETPVPEVKQ